MDTENALLNELSFADHIDRERNTFGINTNHFAHSKR